jgi:hypothetical protein
MTHRTDGDADEDNTAVDYNTEDYAATQTTMQLTLMQTTMQQCR